MMVVNIKKTPTKLYWLNCKPKSWKLTHLNIIGETGASACAMISSICKSVPYFVSSLAEYVLVSSPKNVGWEKNFNNLIKTSWKPISRGLMKYLVYYLCIHLYKGDQGFWVKILLSYNCALSLCKIDEICKVLARKPGGENRFAESYLFYKFIWW